MNIRPMFPAEETYFFGSDTKDNQFIGYLRGDFDTDGHQFYTAFFDGNAALKTPDFLEEFDRIINELRTQGLLASRNEMAKYCRIYPATIIPSAYNKQYGFVVSSAQYKLYIRANPVKGDYNFYVYCYSLCGPSVKKELLE